METDKIRAEVDEAQKVRRLAFFGVTLSTAATIVCVLSVPMVKTMFFSKNIHKMKNCQF